MTVEVRLEDGSIVCEYGTVENPRTAFHTYASGQRPCFHALKPLPPVVLFGLDHIMGVGPQPYSHTAIWPCILSRNADLVTMAFDQKGPISRLHHSPRNPFKPKAIFHYRLLPVRWDDEHSDAPNLLLGVQPTEGPHHE